MLESTLKLRDSTEMYGDPFSDILKLTRPESLITGGFTAGGRWALRFPAPDKIKFFAIIQGSCLVILEGESEPIYFSAGDVGLLTAKRSFILTSHLDVEPVDAMTVFSSSGNPHSPIGQGEDFTHIGGHVLFSNTSSTSDRLLTEVLPPWIRVPAASPQATSFRWLLDQLVQERINPMPGSKLVSDQLAQLLFVQILRAHLLTCNTLPASWLRIHGDPRLVPALKLMHGNPAHTWQLEELAKSCAMSRTTFSQYFHNTAGITPIAYLTQWRMRLAEYALRENNQHISEIAQSVGYKSESAFSNAFKREMGLSPKAWRRAVRT